MTVLTWAFVLDIELRGGGSFHPGPEDVGGIYAGSEFRPMPVVFNKTCSGTFENKVKDG